MKNLMFVVLTFVLFSCGQNKIQIGNLSETQVGNYAADELNKYLGQLYTGVHFETVGENPNADILFLLNEQADKLGLLELPAQKESFKIIQRDNKLYIVSPDERGLLNAAYALLEKQGCGFYISGDVLPKTKKWTGFGAWEMEDRPLTGDRFVFNWHNFLSGCTGWNLEDWQMWIDQSNKMRYNGIMVHAYGNNPMFSFEYLGLEKPTGYLNNTASGRDWGNQHVNDVRRMVGGEIFEGPVFGSEASLASEENKNSEATKLMKQVFEYAEERGTKLIFALDFDTWSATPKNMMAALPEDALLKPCDDYVVINPDHPDGYNYYKAVLTGLLKMYPEIDQLAVWHRRPDYKTSGWSPWMSFKYEQFPESWKKEYLKKLKQHPELEDNLKSSGMFAYGKVIQAIQKARNEIKPELEITAGSWRFDFVKYADAMYPRDVPLLPLDWEVVFDTPQSIEILAKAGKNREIYPIVWAHHDDHRYIGRPYTPWDNLIERLKNTNSKGFGIIHWTTHPLDLYFTSSARQVWQSTVNESLKTTVDNYVATNFRNDTEKLSQYYYNWLTTGPMFGRETSDHFVDLGKQNLGHKLESWAEMKAKALERIKLLNEIPSVKENNYLQYQKAMEDFYISFFENQMLFQDAFELARDSKIDEAKILLSNANPDEAIQKYTDATKLIGFTSGEKSIVFTMNTRWKADFINLRQRLGMESVHFKFAPTLHDPLAQAPGNLTYFIDEKGRWWRCLWKHELEGQIFGESSEDTFLEVMNEAELSLSSIHQNILPANDYELVLLVLEAKKPVKVSIFEEGRLIASGNGNNLKYKSEGGKLTCRITVPSAKLTGYSNFISE